MERKNKFCKSNIEEIEDDNVCEIVVERDKGFSIFEALIIILISIFFGTAIGFILGTSKSFSNETSNELQEFISTYEGIVENYYEDINEKELLDAAVSGMINYLDDPHSAFMNEEDTNVFNEAVDGSYVGIGVTVQWIDNKFKIVDVLNNSPAEKVGLKVNDIIIEVDGKDVSNKKIDELSELIKGKTGTLVSLVVMRNEEKFSVKVKRGNVEVESVSSKLISKDDKNIGYIHIDSFAFNTATQFEKRLKSLEKENISSLIIDVRNNPGGRLAKVNDILELFFDKNTILYQIQTNDNKEKIYSKKNDKKTYPVVILVNKASASAAEILASSFQDNYKNAIIVGTVSYGKGTIQKAIELSSGASLKYTTQKWLTAKGKWIDGKGVIPDEVVEQDILYQKNPIDENDTQLKKAVEILLK